MCARAATVTDGTKQQRAPGDAGAASLGESPLSSAPGSGAAALSAGCCSSHMDVLGPTVGGQTVVRNRHLTLRLRSAYAKAGGGPEDGRAWAEGEEGGAAA